VKEREKPVNKIIITGASGYIGGELAKRFLQEGTGVWGVGRNAERLNALSQYGDFHPIQAGFEDYDKLDILIPQRGFDRFYHLAWQGTSANDYNDYNVQLANLKAACDAAYAALRLECNGSSCGSSYQDANAVLGESGGFNPVYYGIIHRAASELFQAIAFRHKMPCVNLIFPNTYGVGDKPDTAIMFFIKSLLAHKPLNLISGDCPDDWMPVNDLADGIVAAAASDLRYGDYYIGHRRITTFKEKLLEMKQILGSASDLNWGKYPENYYVDYSRFDLEALYRDTGWEAKTGFGDSIRQTAEWIRSASVLPPPPIKHSGFIYIKRCRPPVSILCPLKAAA
jgi:nucleoside-diphosphate-sugar epimerase